MATFSKRHYEQVAKVLRNTKPLAIESRSNPIATWAYTVRCFSKVFEQDNPSFDASRFLEASEYLK